MTFSPFTQDIGWTASLGQERHCRYQNRFPDSAAFNVPVGATFTGDVDAGAMEAALRAVAARHVPLRSRYAWGETGRLRVHPVDPASVPVTRHDLSRCATDAERAEGLADIGATAAARPFRLESEPATRAHLVRLTANETALVLSVHHASFDGWSSPVFFAELADQYRAATTGEQPRRPVQTHTYADFAVEQRRTLAAGGFDLQLEHWRAALRDPAGPLSWPDGAADPTAPWWAGDMAWASIPADLVIAVQAEARAAGTTLFGWTLAIFKLALHRFSGSSQVAVGTPYAARTDRRWSDTIGFFANTVVMESALATTATFRQLVRSAHAESTLAHRYQDVPYGVVVDTLAPEQVPDRTPYFQTMFIVQNTPLPETAFGPLRLRTTKIVTGSARYDMTFCLGWRRGRLALELETRPALVSQEIAIEFAREFFGLLAASVADPDAVAAGAAPLEVKLGIRRSCERAPGVDGLFEGLVGDWRASKEH